MLWPQVAEHALVPLQAGVSAVACQVIASTCLILPLGKDGLQVHNYMTNGGQLAVSTEAREDLFLCFFFLYLPLYIYVKLERVSRRNIDSEVQRFASHMCGSCLKPPSL